MNTITFQSNRLTFRTWKQEDLPAFSQINADEEVMKFFEKPLSVAESKAMIDRMNKMFEDNGYCYFAVELKSTNELAGMIGLGWKTFAASFTPMVDIGWRLDKKFWNKGLATEGATRCLEYAKEIGIPEVYSLASKKNFGSIRVMQKAGMTYQLDFIHPDLPTDNDLNPCSLYKKTL